MLSFYLVFMFVLTNFSTNYIEVKVIILTVAFYLSKYKLTTLKRKNQLHLDFWNNCNINFS